MVPSRTRSRSICHRSLAAARVEAGGRLVEERARSALATRQAARSSRRRMPPEYVFTSLSAGVGEVEPLEQFVGPGAGARLRGRWWSRPIISRLSRPLSRRSTVACCEATPMRRRTSSGCATTSKPATQRLALGRDRQRGEDADRRGLAGAVVAEQAEHRARARRRGRGRAAPRGRRTACRDRSPGSPRASTVDADAVITFVWRTSSSYIVRTVLAVHCTNGKR